MSATGHIQSQKVPSPADRGLPAGEPPSRTPSPKAATIGTSHIRLGKNFLEIFGEAAAARGRAVTPVTLHSWLAP